MVKITEKYQNRPSHKKKKFKVQNRILIECYCVIVLLFSLCNTYFACICIMSTCMFLYFIVFISDVNFVLYSDTNLVIKKCCLRILWKYLI